MVRDMRTRIRTRITQWLSHRHGARTRSTRNLARASAEKRRADAATVRLAEAEQALRDSDAQVQALVDRCRANRAVIMEAEYRMGRANELVARARRTMNINPKGAHRMLDQAARLLAGDA